MFEGQKGGTGGGEIGFIWVHALIFAIRVHVTEFLGTCTNFILKLAACPRTEFRTCPRAKIRACPPKPIFSFAAPPFRFSPCVAADKKFLTSPFISPGRSLIFSNDTCKAKDSHDGDTKDARSPKKSKIPRIGLVSKR